MAGLISGIAAGLWRSERNTKVPPKPQKAPPLPKIAAAGKLASIDPATEGLIERSGCHDTCASTPDLENKTRILTMQSADHLALELAKAEAVRKKRNRLKANKS